ncbi:MAG TPA: type II CAAX endopeptidase family protein [Terracidiphilus sp.]|jgi:hypothetical protein
MTTAHVPDSRLRAYGQFLFALFYYFLARALARHGADGLISSEWQPVVEQGMLVFLLLLGFAGLGFTLNRQVQPLSAQGFPRRSGWTGEFGMGLAVGWGAAVVCVLAMAILGGITIRLLPSLSAWGWLAVNILYYLLLSLAEEIVFRGYAFQRFARATSSVGAVFGFALLYAFLQSKIPYASRTTAMVSFVLALILSAAYVRTRALWVSWGLNFGWKTSRAILFGLAVNGDTSHSTVVQGDPTGSFWLTGGGFGLESSWFAFLVMLALLPVIYRITRELDFRYNTPEIIPGGIPVDIDAAARRQHEAAMGVAEPAPPALIQIAPIAPLTPPSPPAPENAEASPPNSGNDSL